MNSKVIVSRRKAIERLTLKIVDTLLAYDALDEYWLNLPFSQGELAGRDLIKGRRVPVAALGEIADAVAVSVQESLSFVRGEGGAA